MEIADGLSVERKSLLFFHFLGCLIHSLFLIPNRGACRMGGELDWMGGISWTGNRLARNPSTSVVWQR
jgi:hypothetical protein